MMKEREVILTAKGLKKYYTVDRGMLSHKVKGTVKAVDGLNFQIFRNETLGVIGESGCGKSTLARVLLGLTDATEGSVTCLGTPISTRMPREMRKHVQMVFQDPYSSIDRGGTFAHPYAHDAKAPAHGAGIEHDGAAGV